MALVVLVVLVVTEVWVWVWLEAYLEVSVEDSPSVAPQPLTFGVRARFGGRLWGPEQSVSVSGEAREAWIERASLFSAWYWPKSTRLSVTFRRSQS